MIRLAILTLLAIGFIGAFAGPVTRTLTPGQQVEKSVGVVPKAGPLQGKTVYTGSFALFVGIGSYAQPGIPGIPSAPNDARTIRDILVQKFGFGSDPDRTVVLTNQTATKERIENELARLCDPIRVHKTDRVFIFFSCHGQSIKTLDGDDHGYILPYGATVNLANVNDPTGYQTSCIKMDDMVGKLAECPANHRVVVLDACFSGLAVSKDVAAPTEFDPGVVNDDLGERGLYVLTAGTAKQETFGVSDAQGLSIFTRAFADTLKEYALQKRTAFIDQIGFDAAARTVAASKGRQRPAPQPKSGAGSMLFFPVAGRSDLPTPAPVPDNIVSPPTNTGGSGVAAGNEPATVTVEVCAASGDLANTYCPETITRKFPRGKEPKRRCKLHGPEIATVPPVAGGKRLSKKGDVEMVFIPEGEFTMGGSGNFEKPIRKVFLDAYAIGVNDVTVGQFKAYCTDAGVNFSKFTAPPWGWIDTHPMVNVSWQEARDYCKWAGGDLPTEAQWEKAARGKDGLEYPWGHEFDASRLWCSKADFSDAKSTAPVGNFPSGASPFGCLDMAGNVWQWCLDYFTSQDYSDQPDRNPTGPGGGLDHIWRGGSWIHFKPDMFRSAMRNFSDANYSCKELGFRLAGPP